MTSTGRCSCSATQATVAVLPVPVAPSRTVSFSPSLIRSVICGDRGGLVPGRGHVGDDLERRHLPLQVGYRTHVVIPVISRVTSPVPRDCANAVARTTPHDFNSTAGGRHSCAVRGGRAVRAAPEQAAPGAARRGRLAWRRRGRILLDRLDPGRLVLDQRRGRADRGARHLGGDQDQVGKRVGDRHLPLGPRLPGGGEPGTDDLHHVGPARGIRPRRDDKRVGRRVRRPVLHAVDQVDKDGAAGGVRPRLVRLVVEHAEARPRLGEPRPVDRVLRRHPLQRQVAVRHRDTVGDEAEQVIEWKPGQSDGPVVGRDRVVPGTLGRHRLQRR